MQDTGGNRSKSDLIDRPPKRSYEKPTPKSYYTLSVTDDEKLMDEDYMQGVTPGLQDMNVTVTGDRRSFKDRENQRSRLPAATRGQGSSGVQQGFEDRREGSGPVSKHQPSLPPRLQQQQQQERTKRQKQQQQTAVEKQDSGQGRSNKRYSSQRQRPVVEGPGFTEPQVSQSPPAQQVVSSLQQFQQSKF